MRYSSHSDSSVSLPRRLLRTVAKTSLAGGVLGAVSNSLIGSTGPVGTHELATWAIGCSLAGFLVGFVFFFPFVRNGLVIGAVFGISCAVLFGVDDSANLELVAYTIYGLIVVDACMFVSVVAGTGMIILPEGIIAIPSLCAFLHTGGPIRAWPRLT